MSEMVKHPHLENIYSTRDGEIYKLTRGKFIKANKFKTIYGYVQINLAVNKKQKCFFVHRILAETFIKNNLSLPVVNHINGKKDDNRLENLEWVTSKQNTLHAVASGLVNTRGRNNPMAISDDMQVLTIRTVDACFFKKSFIFKNYNVSRKRKEMARRGWINLPRITKEEVINERSKYGNDFIKR
jgi:hypothetical protein